MCPPAISSAAGLLALLDEGSDDLKRHALINIDRVVHDYWYQISGSIASVEALYEDDEFSHRELAALVASKVFYHLGELDDALSYALGAGSLFNVEEESEYIQTLVCKCKPERRTNCTDLSCSRTRSRYADAPRTSCRRSAMP
eukprot:237396-Chlamydomonas_euryale.AAC.2